MKRFILNCIVFAFIPLPLFFFVEYSLRTMDSRYEKKRNGLFAQKDSIEILIVGTSHAADGITPKAFTKHAYNMAFGSQTILYDIQIIDKFIPYLPKLKYVIFSIDYPSLYWGIETSRDFFYYYYYGINIQEKSFIKENLSYFFYVYTPVNSVKLIYNNYFNKDTLKFVNGWAGWNETNKSLTTEKEAIKKVKYFDDIIKKSKDYKTICSQLESIIISLKAKGITPIIVTSPGYIKYTSHLDSSILSTNLQFIKMLQLKYDIDYLNSLNDTTFKLNHFYDSDHLNKFGAIKFSRQIDSLINK